MKRYAFWLSCVLLIVLCMLTACEKDDVGKGDGAAGSEEALSGSNCMHTSMTASTKNATCTEDGLEEKRCNICGTIFTTVLKAKGHSEVTDKAVNATCTTDGKTAGKHCSVCHEVLVEQQINVKALGHTEVTDKAVNATCIRDGKTEGKHCVVCNEILVAQETIKATGHSYVKSNEVAPTKTSEGYTLYKCSCGDNYKKNIYSAGSAGLAYTVDSDGKSCTVTGMGSCKDIDVVIPGIINDYQVTGIGKKAFYYESIESITIPNGITSIGDSAFEGNSEITSITLPNSIMSIGEEAFKDCTGLVSITIPFVGANKNASGYTSHFGYIFGYNKSDGYSNHHHYYDSNTNCYYTYNIPSSLKSVVITGGKSIMECAFRNTGLSNVTILDSVKRIECFAFENCYGLTSVTIGSGVTSIGERAFYNCTELIDINISKENAKYKSVDGSLYTKDEKTLIQYAAGKANLSFVIPEGVINIENYAFYNCKTLTIITIPDSVKIIGDYVFSGCSALTSVAIGSGVTSIGSHAFEFCSKLTNVTIGSGVTNIGDRAFFNCTGLTSVTISNGVMSIGSFVFYGCTGLTSMIIPDSVTSIGYSAFYNCAGLASVTIGSGVKSIDDHAFHDCKGLKTINYRGTKVEWEAISKGDYWNRNTGSYTIKYNYTKDSEG